MAVTFAFDVYGTLIDTHGLVSALDQWLGPKALEFSQHWRTKQLEYSFRRGLMGCYVDFSSCTADALRYTNSVFDSVLPGDAIEKLLSEYNTLPPFPDVKPALGRFRSSGHRLFAFSNGSSEKVTSLLGHAGLLHLFDGVVSVADVRSFKPDPRVYQHFLNVTGATSVNTWLISSNPFDVIGAQAVGYKTVWVKRNPQAVFDPWGSPTLTVNSLDSIANMDAGNFI